MDRASDREEEEQASYLATLTTSHSSFGSDLEVATSVCQLCRKLAPLGVQAPSLAASRRLCESLVLKVWKGKVTSL